MPMFFISLGVMLLLIMSGAWIAISLGFGGIIALIPKIGDRVWDLVSIQAFTTMTSFELLAVPLFVFMGEFIGRCGIAERVYAGVSQFLRGTPGGLEQTNIVACGFFAAISGSSVAGAATMGKIAYPELTQRGYDKRLTLGSVAAGGTLGILIPPSIPLIIYGLIAEESVGALFMAGIMPGLMLIGFYMLYIGTRATLQPDLVPRENGATGWRTRILGILEVWPFIVLMILVLGSIYLGIATPTESAAIGAIGAIFVALAFNRFSWETLTSSLLAAVKTTSMIMLIVICAKITVQALVYYGISYSLAEWITGLGSPILCYIVICISFLILGCLFEPLSMMVLTIPIFVPVLVALGFSKVWFGIVVTISAEIGMLTPPVGLNLFVIQGVTGQAIEEVVRGTWPFIVGNVLLLWIVYQWPAVALWLPSLMIR